MAPKKPKLKREKKASRKKTAKAPNNRRKFRRYDTPSLWVTERSGDYQFSLQAENISEGGVFLQGRLKTSQVASELVLHLGKHGMVTVTADPVHDSVSDKSYGTGYRFSSLVTAQAKVLRSFFRDLD